MLHYRLKYGFLLPAGLSAAAKGRCKAVGNGHRANFDTQTAADRHHHKKDMEVRGACANAYAYRQGVSSILMRTRSFSTGRDNQRMASARRHWRRDLFNTIRTHLLYNNAASRLKIDDTVDAFVYCRSVTR